MPPRLTRGAALTLALMALPALHCHGQSMRILVQNSPLAGFQYHAGAAHWDEMRVDDELELVREPDNPHDPHAVRIEWRGTQLGYLPRAENRAVAAALDAGQRVQARIAHLRAHRNPWKRIGIDVFIQP